MSQEGLEDAVPLSQGSPGNGLWPLELDRSRGGHTGLGGPQGAVQGKPPTWVQLSNAAPLSSQDTERRAGGCYCCWSRASATLLPSRRSHVTSCTSSCIKGDLLAGTPGSLSPWGVEARLGGRRLSAGSKGLSSLVSPGSRAAAARRGRRRHMTSRVPTGRGLSPGRRLSPYYRLWTPGQVPKHTLTGGIFLQPSKAVGDISLAALPSLAHCPAFCAVPDLTGYLRLHPPRSGPWAGCLQARERHAEPLPYVPLGRPRRLRPGRAC